ncbi:MAG: hypothetical protein GY757_01320 [bacterium]|nr:hypothetical protein [bacterium]
MRNTMHTSFKHAVSLFVPAHLPGLLEKAFRMSIGSLLIDRCKLVPPEEKFASRYLVNEALKEFTSQGKHICLWFNPMNTPEYFDDLELLSGNPVHRIRIGGKLTPGDVENLREKIDKYTGEEKEQKPDLEIVIDNWETFCNLEGICRAKAGIGTLSVSPFQKPDMEGGTGEQEIFFAEVKQGIVKTARKYGLVPVDTVSTNYEDPEGFRVECETSLQTGFTGRPVVHPAQIKIALDCYPAPPYPKGI